MPPLYRQAPSLSRCSAVEVVFLTHLERESALAICATFRRKPSVEVALRDVPVSGRQPSAKAASALATATAPGSGLPSSDPAAR